MKGSIKVTVEKVKVEGNGAILLTGPSGCGKGEIAKALCKLLLIPKDRHLSMGDILRKTINKAKEDEKFMQILSEKYFISKDVSIFDTKSNKPEIVEKAKKYHREIISSLKLPKDSVSQFEWLEFCIENGLLIPDEWTENIIEALLESSSELYKGIFIIDGYPRTINAAKHLVDTLNKSNIPIIKVIHLFITKEQMKVRALNRGRIDDRNDSLERRYEFYTEKVQPSVEYLKNCLGNSMVSLVDGQQPIYDGKGEINIEASINAVVLSVLKSLDLPDFLMDIK